MSDPPPTPWPPPEARELQRPQWLARVGLAVLIAACLALYLFAYRPAASRVRSLADSLAVDRERLARHDFGSLANPGGFLAEAEGKLADIRELAGRMEQRATFQPDIPELLRTPFRVLEFEQRRFIIFRDLNRLAEETGARLPFNFSFSLPAYAADAEEPRYAWIYLEFFNHIVERLLQCGDGIRIESIEALPERRYRFEEDADELLELRYRIDASGDIVAFANFLNATLPEQATDDGRSRGYFIDHIESHRVSPVETDSAAGLEPRAVRLNIQLSGFATVPASN